MRAVFSLLSLVIVAAIVLWMAKKQLPTLQPAASAASAAEAASAQTH
jgi:hypothetical protein